MVPEIRYVSLQDCHTARGTVVVIDVCRAFTTAAYAFGAGAQQILLVSGVDEAFALRERMPGALLMGEVGGMHAEGFDFWNSPVQISTENLEGRTLVQRTSAGTQGVVRAITAEHLFAGSFAVASATVRAVQLKNPREVTFVVTGTRQEDDRFGQEDRACADYMAQLLRGEAPDPGLARAWEQSFLLVHNLTGDLDEVHRQFLDDLVLCQDIDRFRFALPVIRRDGLLIMEKSYVHSD